jgi:hypothetical protein
MPLDVLEADLVWVARDGVDSSARPRRVDARGLTFELMVKVLQRDDPLRRSYLQRRWHGHPTSTAREARRCSFGRTSLSPIVLNRR